MTIINKLLHKNIEKSAYKLALIVRAIVILLICFCAYIVFIFAHHIKLDQAIIEALDNLELYQVRICLSWVYLMSYIFLLYVPSLCVIYIDKNIKNLLYIYFIISLDSKALSRVDYKKILLKDIKISRVGKIYISFLQFLLLFFAFFFLPVLFEPVFLYLRYDLGILSFISLIYWLVVAACFFYMSRYDFFNFSKNTLYIFLILLFMLSIIIKHVNLDWIYKLYSQDYNESTNSLIHSCIKNMANRYSSLLFDWSLVQSIIFALIDNKNIVVKNRKQKSEDLVREIEKVELLTSIAEDDKLLEFVDFMHVVYNDSYLRSNIMGNLRLLYPTKFPLYYINEAELNRIRPMIRLLSANNDVFNNDELKILLTDIEFHNKLFIYLESRKTRIIM